MLMTTASDEKWRRRVERCCVELGDGLYRRPMPWPWMLVMAVIASVAIWYFYGRPSEYSYLLERASKYGASTLFLAMSFGLPWAVRLLLLPPVYLLLRRGHVSGVLLKKVVSWTVAAFLATGLSWVLFDTLVFPREPISEAAASWIAGMFMAFLAVMVFGVLFEPLASLLLRRGGVNSPWFRALSITVCPSLEPVAQVGGQTLTLGLAGNLFWLPPPIQAPLANLRGLTIRKTSFYTVVLEFTDGHTETILPRYSSPACSRVAEFLRRKLPASVKLTVEER